MILDDCYASYVNLDHRRDRRRRMEQTLKQVGIKATRTRGPLPREWPGNPARVQVMSDRTPGSIGCYMGQVQIMEEAQRRGQHAFVMEDDLVFCADFHKRMTIIEEFIATHPWDVVWLGATFHVNPPVWHPELGRDAETTDHPRIMRCYGAFSTHAYIVNRASIGGILVWLDRILDQSIGIDYSFIRIQPDLYAYSFVPGCIIQVDGRSDIGRGMTTFSKFASLGPYWYQARAEDFDPTVFDWAEARA